MRNYKDIKENSLYKYDSIDIKIDRIIIKKIIFDDKNYK